MVPAWTSIMLSAGPYICSNFSLWPKEEPCPSDECISLCVSTFHQQHLSFSGHWKDGVAGGYGAKVKPMTIVFSKNQHNFNMLSGHSENSWQ